VAVGKAISEIGVNMSDTDRKYQVKMSGFQSEGWRWSESSVTLHIDISGFGGNIRKLGSIIASVNEALQVIEDKLNKVADS